MSKAPGGAGGGNQSTTKTWRLCFHKDICQDSCRPRAPLCADKGDNLATHYSLNLPNSARGGVYMAGGDNMHISANIRQVCLVVTYIFTKCLPILIMYTTLETYEYELLPYVIPN
jgi:hypothetical protein